MCLAFFLIVFRVVSCLFLIGFVVCLCFSDGRLCYVSPCFLPMDFCVVFRCCLWRAFMLCFVLYLIGLKTVACGRVRIDYSQFFKHSA